MIVEMKDMKLWESYDRGLIHPATRLVVPPMATQSGDDGFPTARTVGHYTRLAANSGVGLLFTEHSYIVKQGKADPWQLGFETDEVIPYQHRLTDAVHAVHPGNSLLCPDQPRWREYIGGSDRGGAGICQRN